MITIDQTPAFPAFAAIAPERPLPHPELLPLAETLAFAASDAAGKPPLIDSEAMRLVRGRLHRLLAAEVAAGRLSYMPEDARHAAPR